MPAPTGFPAGAPIWFDLSTSDVAGATAFYTELFGWKAEDKGPDMGDYVVLTLAGKQVGGLIANPDPGAFPDAWLVYLHTADADTAATAVTGAGGLVHRGASDVMDLGRMLIVEDNARATVAGWQPGTNPGFEVLAEPGAPAWFELHTTSFYDSVQFYQQAFGWQTNTMSDTPEFKYAQLMVDGMPYAGVMDASAYWPAGAPAAWLVYVNVDDPDATLAKAAELGGKVVDEAADTPFGRMGMLSDPTGALIKVIGAMPQG